MRNALLDQKTLRKTLVYEMSFLPTRSRGFRHLPCLPGGKPPWTRVVQALTVTGPPFPSVAIQANDGDQEKKQVQRQVRSPGQAPEYTAAGTGYLLPETQHGKGGIAAEQQQKSECDPQAGAPPPAGQQQQHRGQFQRGDQKSQRSGQRPGNGLGQQLGPEAAEVGELGNGGITEQQYEQGGWHLLEPGKDTVWIRHDVF